MCVLDRPEWQRDHHRQMRGLLGERVKGRDSRYTPAKHRGVVGASMAGYRTQQLTVAARTLTLTLGRRGWAPA
ncbi:hypothetical protein NXY56_000851 [Leishmania guyanensis]